MSLERLAYHNMVGILAAELFVVAEGFERLTAAQWRTPTNVSPPESGNPPWTVFELAGHLDISIGITGMLIAEAVPGEPEPELDAVNFFISSRIVEAVVHGIDLTDALDRPSTATPDGIAHTVRIMDDLLARSGVGGRPTDLESNTAWLRAASGRTPHPDPRLPRLA